MKKILFIILTLLIINSFGCSSKGIDPITSSPNLTNYLTVPDFPLDDIGSENIERTLLGMWNLDFDSESKMVNISSNRTLSAHYNVKSFIPAPTIQIVNHDPLTSILDIDVTINNSTLFDVYDLRLIIFTDNLGIRLFNWDDWTGLYDIPGGAQINPFRAYAKHIPDRKFEAYSQNTERLQLYFPPASPYLNFAIDASYPSNCAEPYLIQNFEQGVLYDAGGSQTTVSVEIFDWQGDTDTVELYCSQIIGNDWAMFEQVSSIEWEMNLTNNLIASEGEYLGVIKANSPASAPIYDLVKIDVSHMDCPAATEISLTDTINGNLNLDEEDWFYAYSTPKGIRSGTVELTIPSGLVDVNVYGHDPDEFCPGTELVSATNVGSTTLDIPASHYSKIYVQIIGRSPSISYTMDVNIVREVSHLNCDIYVATDDGTPTGRWPVYDNVLPPDQELTLTHINNLVDWCNDFWIIYGYRFIWDGTVTIIDSGDHYVIETGVEAAQVHNDYGRDSGLLSLYFVNDLPEDQAYCSNVYPEIENNVTNVRSYFSPGRQLSGELTPIWDKQVAIAHEHGHAIGYLFDQYRYSKDDPVCDCGDNVCMCNKFPQQCQGYDPYLYWCSDACNDGNLMWYTGTAPWYTFDLTDCQIRKVHQFNFNYPTNFPWY